LTFATFEYLTVLISIILGLGITQLLGGLGRLLQDRARVRMYWPAVVWVCVLLLLHVQTWWAMFGLRSLESWTFLAFLLVLLQPVVLFMLAALVLPDGRAESDRDLRANYYAQSRWFFALGVTLLVVSLTRDLVLSGHLPGTFNTGVHVLLLVLWSLAAITRHELYHRGVAAATALVMIAYVAVLFRDLP
jgi:hypothetical protein